MIILPAIDIKGGQCVRLYKGDFSTAHKVADSAKETAIGFKNDGAQMVHVVDLDGALEGKPANISVIESIISTGIKVELGGGIRDMETIESLLNMGVSRVILGSAALKKPQFVKQAVEAYANMIAVGIDAKDGYVSVEGWLEKSDINYIDFARQMEQIGVGNIIFTDIGRDGTLEGPNIESLIKLKEAVSCDITASGGIKDINDIKKLAEIKMYAAIAGKAVYSATLNLKQAISLAEGMEIK